MKRFRLAFAVITGVLFLHGLGLLQGWYDQYEWFDIPMHFLGGLAMGVLGISLLKAARAQFTVASYTKKADWYLKLLRFGWVMGFVALIGIAWEWMEFFVDQFLDLPDMQQPGVGDTMADFFFDLLGGGLAYLLVGRGKE